MTGFFRCGKCGKKILKRLPNGLWEFAFGKFSTMLEKESNMGPIVQINIYGSLKMKCLRRRCRVKYPDFWNILNFFPNPKEEEKQSSDLKESGKINVNSEKEVKI